MDKLSRLTLATAGCLSCLASTSPAVRASEPLGMVESGLRCMDD